MTAAMLDAGVIVLTAGENTLRFAPALNIPPPDITEGFTRINNALKAITKPRRRK